MRMSYKEIQTSVLIYPPPPLCFGTESESGSVKKEKEKKNRKKDKENGSSSGEGGSRKDIDAPDAVVSSVYHNLK